MDCLGFSSQPNETLARVITYINDRLCMLVTQLPKVRIDISSQTTLKVVLVMMVFLWNVRQSSAEDLVRNRQDCNVSNVDYLG